MWKNMESFLFTILSPWDILDEKFYLDNWFLIMFNIKQASAQLSKV